MTAPAQPKRMGRPPLAPDAKRAPETRPRSIRLTDDLAAKLDRLGGSQWIREQIEQAPEPR